MTCNGGKGCVARRHDYGENAAKGEVLITNVAHKRAAHTSELRTFAKIVTLHLNSLVNPTTSYDHAEGHKLIFYIYCIFLTSAIVMACLAALLAASNVLVATTCPHPLLTPFYLKLGLNIPLRHYLLCLYL